METVKVKITGDFPGADVFEVAAPVNYRDMDATALAVELLNLNPDADWLGNGNAIIVAMNLVGPPTEVEEQASPDAAVAAGASGGDLPLGERNESWDAGKARGMADTAADLARMHFWKDPNGDPEAQSSYKLPFAYLDGNAHAVWNGVTAAAAAMQGSRGGVNIPDGDVAAVRSKIAGYYAKARSKYDDDTIEPPWASSESSVSTARSAVRRARAAAAIETVGGTWIADPLALEDTMTRDGRIFDAGALVWNKQGEMTLMAQFENPEMGGHAGAVVAGSMPGSKIKRAGNVLTASGQFNTDEPGQQAEEYVSNRSLTGISIDIAPQEWQIEISPEAGGGILMFSAEDDEPVDGSDEGGPIVIEQSSEDMVLRFKKAELIGSTLVATPAFGETQVSLAASSSGWPIPKVVRVTGYVRMADPYEASLAASMRADLRPQSIEDLSMLTDVLDRGVTLGFVSLEDAKLAFLRALQERS
jgi:hypothetical protein